MTSPTPVLTPIESLDLRELPDEGHDRLAHYGEKNAITEGLVFGTPLKTLCGKVMVPTRSPDGFPVCAPCQEIYDALPPGPPPAE